MLFELGVCLVLIGRPDANRVIENAMRAESAWLAFPGFVADLEVEWDGKVHHGRAVVAPGGRVFVEQVPAARGDWVAQRLGLAVHQRLPKDDLASNGWMFVDRNDDFMPTGQAICSVDAPFGPCHWIRDGRIHAIGSRAAQRRQLRTTVKTELNGDGKHLPTVEVFQSWKLPWMELETAETTIHTWQRVGRFDLPATLHFISGGPIVDPSTPTTVRIVLTRPRLFVPPSESLAVR
jgi:hypothetical protein